MVKAKPARLEPAVEPDDYLSSHGFALEVSVVFAEHLPGIRRALDLVDGSQRLVDEIEPGRRRERIFIAVKRKMRAGRNQLVYRHGISKFRSSLPSWATILSGTCSREIMN